MKKSMELKLMNKCTKNKTNHKTHLRLHHYYQQQQKQQQQHNHQQKQKHKHHYTTINNSDIFSSHGNIIIIINKWNLLNCNLNAKNYQYILSSKLATCNTNFVVNFLANNTNNNNNNNKKYNKINCKNNNNNTTNTTTSSLMCSNRASFRALKLKSPEAKANEVEVNNNNNNNNIDDDEEDDDATKENLSIIIKKKWKVVAAFQPLLCSLILFIEKQTRKERKKNVFINLFFTIQTPTTTLPTTTTATTNEITKNNIIKTNLISKSNSNNNIYNYNNSNSNNNNNNNNFINSGQPCPEMERLIFQRDDDTSKYNNRENCRFLKHYSYYTNSLVASYRQSTY